MNNKRNYLFLIIILSVVTPTLAAEKEAEGEDESFLSAVEWKKRFGVTDFQVEDSDTFGLTAGIKGQYETAQGIKLTLLLTVIVDNDQDKLDPDHIPVWFKNYFRAEKEILAPTHALRLLATLDVQHRMNTVSSIEQSADLMPGIKIDFATEKIEFFAKFGAGGYYLEIDDDLPKIHGDFRREDLSSEKFAFFQEYRVSFSLADRFSLSGRYKDFRETGNELLETREELKLAYRLNPARYLVFKVEKTTYELDQFERLGSDNGLAILPFNEDTFFQAYVEYDF